MGLPDSLAQAFSWLQGAIAASSPRPPILRSGREARPRLDDDSRSIRRAMQFGLTWTTHREYIEET